ncbi:MAG TPA: ABC transporter permease, partial [Anaerolineales bacterium]|nr:ABC transporter permease [Anaerolineales bacterium]
MIRPRWHKVLADLKGNLARSLLAMASIAVGLIALGVIATLHTVVSEDMRSGYASVNPANIQLTVAGINQDLVDHIRRMKDVRQAEGTRNFGLRLEASPGEWITINVRAIPEIEQNQINQLRLLEGNWPPADKQIVIERYKLGDTHAQLGDYLTVELPSGQTRNMQLVGVVNDQTLGAFSASAGFFLAPVQVYVTQNTL